MAAAPARSITITVPADIRDYFMGAHTQGQGGFQSLARLLAERLTTTRTLQLSPEEFSRVVHYARAYGEGGFQSRLCRLVVEYVHQHFHELTRRDEEE